MIDASYPSVRADRERITREALAALFADQEFDVTVARRVLGPGWDKRLARRMFELNLATATAIGDRVASRLPGEFTPAFMHNWLLKNAESGATAINDSTREALSLAEDDEAKAAVFASLTTTSAALYARTMVTTAANFGAQDPARAAGAKTKTWSGGTTRHAGMNGETVPLSENFSNGMAWPGDPAGGAAEVANCGCSLTLN
jgi:hypothetical protein